jgi:DNA-binding NarL/FixJ family response regulator
VRRLGAGGSVLDPAVVSQLGKAIAERLFVSEYTVEKHVGNIFTTLRLPPSPDDHRRVLAVAAYLNAQ